MRRKSQASLKDHAEMVARLRSESGLSSKDASVLCALSKNVWSSVEKGERPLPKPAFELFCLKIGMIFSDWSDKVMHLPSDELKSVIESDPIFDLSGLSESEKLGCLRTHLKLDIADVSKFAGLSRDNWKAMEAGEAQISAPAVELLCLKFEINSIHWAIKQVYVFDKKLHCIVPVN